MRKCSWLIFITIIVILFIPHFSYSKARYVRLYLKLGDVIDGKLLNKSGSKYMIEYEGGVVVFGEDEVDAVEFRDIKPSFDENTGENQVKEEAPKKEVAVYLKSGSVVKGELVKETKNFCEIIWEGQNVKFYSNEIERVEVLKTEDGAPDEVSAANDGIKSLEEDTDNRCRGEDAGKNFEEYKARLTLDDGTEYEGDVFHEDNKFYKLRWHGQELVVDAGAVVRVDRLESSKSVSVEKNVSDDEADRTSETDMKVTGDFSEKAENDTDDVAKMVILYLKNGNAISGELIFEDDNRYQIKWQGSILDFYKDEIEKVKRHETIDTEDGVIFVPKEDNVKWEYKNDVVVKLYNGEVVDAEIYGVDDNSVHVRKYLDEGGNIELDIKRDDIDYLLFKPVKNKETEEIETSLMNLFPGMTRYKNSNITVYTDSYIVWARKYRKVLNKTQTEIYLKFFELFKTRKQSVQNFVVIFDDYEKWIEFTASDGIPGWMVWGYFSPDRKTLFLFNQLGDKVENFIRSVMKDLFENRIDASVEALKSRVDKSYHLSIEGQARGIKGKFEEYFQWHMDRLKHLTFSTLMHEFTHETFSNWGIQMIVLSKFSKASFGDIEKKRKLFETDNPEEKKRILNELITGNVTSAISEIEAANSWLSEGLATYCETYPEIGRDNKERIYEFQQMLKEDSFLPLEQLSAYKIGSFRGVYPKAMLYAYAESWAFVKFFMEKYPNKFIKYLNEYSKLKDVTYEEDVELLEKLIGKGRRELESELMEFMGQYEEVDDPVVTLLERRKQLYDSLVNMGDVK